MRTLILIALSVLPLCAADAIPLERFLSSAAASDTAQTLKTQSAVNAAQRRGAVLSEGFMLNGELDYASAKNESRDEVEYHLSVEKGLRLGDSDTYLEALKLSAAQEATLQINRFKSVVLEHYINACALAEKFELLNDAHDRNRELTALIDAGVEGGEFDRSALLRSELVTEELQLRLDDLESRYHSALKLLHSATGIESTTLLCRDLPPQIVIAEDPEAQSLLYRRLESEIASAAALKRFRDTPLQSVTVGAGYDNEMDVSRGLLFLQIPLTPGSRLENDRETARLSHLAAEQELNIVQTRMRDLILAYKNTQKTRRHTLQRLNDELIPKAYESTVLLEERFIGSEGSYLAYIDSQKALFDLLIRGVDTRTEALLANASLYYTLGIDPQKELK